jgi:hypothetical protein
MEVSVTIAACSCRVFVWCSSLVAPTREREGSPMESTDDFGTGYASFSGLQSLPFYKLRIDNTSYPASNPMPSRRKSCAR